MRGKFPAGREFFRENHCNALEARDSMGSSREFFAALAGNFLHWAGNFLHWAGIFLHRAGNLREFLAKLFIKLAIQSK
jgi:hypothetical protein